MLFLCQQVSALKIAPCMHSREFLLLHRLWLLSVIFYKPNSFQQVWLRGIGTCSNSSARTCLGRSILPSRIQKEIPWQRSSSNRRVMKLCGLRFAHSHTKERSTEQGARAKEWAYETCHQWREDTPKAIVASRNPPHLKGFNHQL